MGFKKRESLSLQIHGYDLDASGFKEAVYNAVKAVAEAKQWSRHVVRMSIATDKSEPVE